MVIVEFAQRQMADSAPAQPGREVPAAGRISSIVSCPKSGEHNNSQELTRLAAEDLASLCLPRCARMGQAMPGPPSSSARIR